MKIHNVIRFMLFDSVEKHFYRDDYGDLVGTTMQLSFGNAIFFFLACIAPGVVSGLLAVALVLSPFEMFLGMSIGCILVPMAYPLLAPRLFDGARTIVLRENGLHVQSRKCRASRSYSELNSIRFRVQNTNGNPSIRFLNLDFAIENHQFGFYADERDDPALFNNMVRVLTSARSAEENAQLRTELVGRRTQIQ